MNVILNAACALSFPLTTHIYIVLSGLTQTKENEREGYGQETNRWENSGESTSEKQ